MTNTRAAPQSDKPLRGLATQRSFPFHLSERLVFAERSLFL